MVKSNLKIQMNPEGVTW